MAKRKVPRMTRGHYNFIADTIAQIAQDKHLPANIMAVEFANRLCTTNPRFNKDRFIDYVSNYNVRQLKKAAKEMRAIAH